jgi:hypothetical protein
MRTANKRQGIEAKSAEEYWQKRYAEQLSIITINASS